MRLWERTERENLHLIKIIAGAYDYSDGTYCIEGKKSGCVRSD